MTTTSHFKSTSFFDKNTNLPSQLMNTTCQEQVLQIAKENQEKLTLASKKEAKCNLIAYNKHWDKVEKAMQLEMTKLMAEFRKQIQLDRKLCYKIENRYLAFGLENMIPESLHCQFNIKSIYMYKTTE